jgi:hypothetical protein
VDSSGVPLAVGSTDSHYVLTSLVPIDRGSAPPVVTPVGGWIGDASTANWISVESDANGINNGVYTYTTTFTLSGVDPSTATLSGTWACDDSCTLYLNAVQVASYAAPGWEALANFTVPSGSFKTGTNTLAFVTVNSGGGATGLQVATLTGSASCTSDAACPGQFCNTGTGVCTDKLPSGTMIPTIANHSPTLNGKCATGVGAAVCVAAVCDTNNECGLANGDGTCTPAATGSTICQSGSCSANGKCEPSGGCNVDADCPGGWCDESVNTCMAKLANTKPIPTDTDHTNPTLDDVCTQAAATLVCSSGVCDTSNNECGIANGNPGCTVATANLCQSGACSLLGTCEPTGGCDEDADCPTSPTKQWCDESTHTCISQLPNGGLLPDDPPHTNPTLDGTCTQAAATLVCQSGLCNATLKTCVQCTATDTSACTGLTLLCGPTGLCIASLDGGVDAGAIADAGGGGGSGDGGADGGGGGSGATDAGSDADAGASTDAGELADANGEDAASGDDAGEDGSAGDDASDAGAGNDAGEVSDATTGAGPDGAPGAGNGGAGVSGELEGGGLSCSVSWSGSSNSNDGPLLMLAIVLGAAFGRGRRNR